MRILFMSNAPYCKTGYGTQTKQAVRQLKAMGHDVAILAFYGLEGGVIEWEGMKVYPRRHHIYGLDAILPAYEAHKADLLISLMDIWVLDPRLFDNINYAAWFPIDCVPLQEAARRVAEKCIRPLVFSRFGEVQARKAGLDPVYIPHAIDTELFKPLPKAQAREYFGGDNWSDDRFIICAVADNKGYPSRKGFDQMLGGFKKFLATHQSAMLYIHTNPFNPHGINLKDACDFYGVGDNVMFPDPQDYDAGFDEEYLVNLYSASNVYLNTTLGGGFELPLIEAQACDLPVIAPSWTGMGELVKHGWQLNEVASRMRTQLNASWFVPDEDEIAEKLSLAYRFRARGGRDAIVAEYDHKVVAQNYWKPALIEIEKQIEAKRQASNLTFEGLTNVA